MDKLQDFSDWMHDIIKPDNILLSIRDAARASNVTDAQVRYWIKNGYLRTVKADNGAIKLPYNQIASIRMIKFFLDNGYTLSGAAKKTQENKDIVRSIRHLVFSSIHNIGKQGNKTIFDLGPIDKDPEKHIFGIETPEKITYIIN
ncbi:MerR family transcriptional regulator [Ligilactobacillus acidipiscis DSM 15836]|uniref:MerR family transcriptional regulator n=1 Tax=Ligilactobacillus acidipiscis DSM 15836 TaxID=1423716 RepID=A0ABR5PHJ1_9LACO|nr:MerR family transcriptional regulator [Ligilactobacillus acidipiscis]KRM20228.1 MerR family transcriptional regulator [Ligilactobacillus acidipiscis DSM 15836]GAW65131.1 MerR family transcriptional regulator [Ligilactobacillus acidipiscis]GEN21967.1 hypothetical protein LAC02_52480 [Ligilactobacillus acidipiscis]